MFVRAREAKGRVYYQLVHGYRDDNGKVRQETVGLGSCETVAEALKSEKAALRRLRQERDQIWFLRSSSYATERRKFERADKRVRDCEAKIEKLKEARRAGAS